MYKIMKKRQLNANIYLMDVYAPRVAKSAKPGQFIIIKNDQKELVDCIGINEEGNLIIKNKYGNLEEIMSGEVSIRGVKGYV